MKEIKDIAVVQIRIFPEDSIPYQLLGLPGKLKELKDKFKFAADDIPFPLYQLDTPKVILLRGGELIIENKTVLITLLAFDGRKITLEVAGRSNEADRVFLELANFITSMVERELLSEQRVLTKTEETECTLKLNVDYWEIFSDKMKGFIRNELYQMFERPIVSLAPKKLSFEVIYEQDPSLQRHNISYSPKNFVVEPRANVPLEDKTFYTHSPFDSETHLKLVESFEKDFSHIESQKRTPTIAEPPVRYIRVKPKKKSSEK